MRIFTLGDSHGNTRFLCEVAYPEAARLNADVIVQVGDFGYWEHTEDGVAFLDAVSDAADRYGIPLYWLHGNHDKHSLTLQKYGRDRDTEGFVLVRRGVKYIPQGHVWQWDGVTFRAFGGAYSVDKQWRLDAEKKRLRRNIYREDASRLAGNPPRPIPSAAETLWFPEEQMTAEEFAALMEKNSDPVDVIFSHDKPRGSSIHWLKDLPECLPNQDRLQHALVTHKPKIWIHGHLHYPYSSMVRSGDDDQFTQVVGLAPDDAAADSLIKPWDAWGLLEIGQDGCVQFTPGKAA